MESSNNTLSNFIRMQILINQRGNIVLRNIFLDRWSKYTGSEWVSSSVKIFVSGIGKKVYDKLQRIQKKSIESGDLNAWDITTLTDVLMLTDFPNDPSTKQAKSLERSNLEELKKVRNKFAHNPTLGIDDELFEDLWTKASEVLIFFGCSIEDLNKIKFSLNLSVFQDENYGHANKANSDEATRLKNEANIFYTNGQLEKAIKIYSKAISLRKIMDSEMAALYSNRSVAYLKRAIKNNRHKNSEEIHCALQDGKEAIKLNPTWYRGYFRTANAYFELGEFKKALDFFDNALSLSPAIEELKQSRDNCRMKLGQEARHEHIDPSMMPGTLTDQLKTISARFGVKTTEENYSIGSKLMNEIVPGNVYVVQAHQLIHGTETNYNPEMAAKLYAKAASLGNAEGMYNLGILYKEGKGVKQDFKKFNQLMRQAASQPHQIICPGAMFNNLGVAEAEHSIGLSYDEGIGVRQDNTLAVEWYQKSSDHGCSNASNNLAFLCMSGRGIPLNIERGVQYWKLAANQGNQLAMHSLAGHYLEVEKDPCEAREWFERAVKHGNLQTQLDRTEFEEKLKKLEKRNQGLDNKLTEFENESGISGKDMTYKNRLKRMMRAVEQTPGITDAIDGLESICLSGLKKSSSPTSTVSHKFDRTVLSKFAENGSGMAIRILTSMTHFNNVCGLLMGSDIRKCHSKIIHELSECYRICELVVKLLPAWKEQLCHVVTEALKHSADDIKSDLDKDARICFAHLQMDTLDHMLIFTEQSKRKYPDEKEFHRHHSQICGFLQRYALGVKESEKALKLFPKDVDLMYSRAVHIRLLETKQRDPVIKAYEEFLAVAPPDHRKVPESYYSIANECFYKNAMKTAGMRGGTRQSVKPSSKESMELFNKMEEYYELGLKAEKLQLPCFLPYDSNQKALIENRQGLIPLIKSKFSKDNLGQSSTKTIEMKMVAPEIKPPGHRQYHENLEPNYTMLSDPNRILVIKSHREHLAELRGFAQSGMKIKSNTTTPAHAQIVPVNLAGLNPITFLEMDTLEDKVYKGRVIQVTSVDDAGFGVFPSIRLVLEDENKNLHRAFIYNFPETDEKIVQDKLGFGAKMSILNPYMRLEPRDGQFGIRVDDTASLFLHNSAAEACRFCCIDRAVLHCKCKWACYCSRKCQEMNWKLMKHKLICAPL